jgi:hypothetical protein
MEIVNFVSMPRARGILGYPARGTRKETPETQEAVAVLLRDKRRERQSALFNLVAPVVVPRCLAPQFRDQ